MRKYYLSLLTIFVVVNISYASPQVPDYLIIENDTIPIYNLLVEEYLKHNKQKDDGELFGLKFRENATTFCWRGYQAIYEINNDSLFVSQIIQCGELFDGNKIDIKSSKNNLNEIFKEKVKKNKVLADWFSGSLYVPTSNLLRWDGVFHKTFEEEKQIKIINGKVISISKIINYIDDPNKINRRFNDTISNKLFDKLKKGNWVNENEFDCSEKYIITIGANGKITNVIMSSYQTTEEIKEFWDKNEFDFCITSIFNQLKDLEFDLIKSRGEFLEEQIFIEVWVEEDGTLENWTEH